MRNALLALLTLGPQYGLQLRNEFLRRTSGTLVRSPNSGQVYQTLERCGRDGLVDTAAQTPHGFPTYQLTEAGREQAAKWLSVPDPLAQHKPWQTMLMQVLLARSIAGEGSNELVENYRNFWEQRREAIFASKQNAEDLAMSAAALQIRGALDWLTEVRGTPATVMPLAEKMPTRGRPRKNSSVID